MAKNLSSQDVQQVTGQTPQDLATSLGIGDRFKALQEQQQQIYQAKQNAKAATAILKQEQRASEAAGRGVYTQATEAQRSPDYAAQLKSQAATEKERKQAPTLDAAYINNAGALGAALGFGGQALDTAKHMAQGIGNALSGDLSMMTHQAGQVDQAARDAYAKQASGQPLTAEERAALSRKTSDGITMKEALDDIANIAKKQADQQANNLVDARTADLITQGINDADTNQLGESVHNIMEGKGDFSVNLGNALSAAGSILGDVGLKALEHPAAAFTQAGSAAPYMGAYALGTVGVATAFGGDTAVNTTQNILSGGQQLAGDKQLTEGQAAALNTPEDMQRALRGGMLAASVAQASEALSFGAGKAVAGTLGKVVSREAGEAATRGLVSTEQATAAGLAKRGVALEAATAIRAVERSAVKAEIDQADNVMANLFDKVNHGTATDDEVKLFNEALDTKKLNEAKLKTFETERLAAVEKAKQVSKDLSPEEYSKLAKQNADIVKAHNADVLARRQKIDDLITDVNKNPQNYADPETTLSDLKSELDNLPELRKVPKPEGIVSRLGTAAAKSAVVAGGEALKEAGEEGTEEVFGQYGSGQIQRKGVDYSAVSKAAAIGAVASVAGGHAMHAGLEVAHKAGSAIKSAFTSKSKEAAATEANIPPAPTEQTVDETGFSKAERDAARERTASGKPATDVSGRMAEHFTKVRDMSIEGSLVAFENANPQSSVKDWAAQNPDKFNVIKDAVVDSSKEAADALQRLDTVNAAIDQNADKKPTKQQAKELLDAHKVFNQAAAVKSEVQHIQNRMMNMGKGTNKATLFSHENLETATNDFVNATTPEAKQDARIHMLHQSSKGTQGVSTDTIQTAINNAATPQDKQQIIQAHTQAIQAEGEKLVAREVKHAGARGGTYSDVTGDVVKQLRTRLGNFVVGMRSNDKTAVDEAISGMVAHREHQVKKLAVLNKFIEAMQAHADAKTAEDKATTLAALRQAHTNWSNDYLDQDSEYARDLSKNKIKGLRNMRNAVVNEINQLGAIHNHMASNAEMKGVSADNPTIPAMTAEGTVESKPADTAPVVRSQSTEETQTKPTTSTFGNVRIKDASVLTSIKNALSKGNRSIFQRFYSTDTVNNTVGNNEAKYGSTLLPALGAVFTHLYGQHMSDIESAATNQDLQNRVSYLSQAKGAKNVTGIAPQHRDAKAQQRAIAMAFHQFLQHNGVSVPALNIYDDAEVSRMINFLRGPLKQTSSGVTAESPTGLSVIRNVGLASNKDASRSAAMNELTKLVSQQLHGNENTNMMPESLVKEIHDNITNNLVVPHETAVATKGAIAPHNAAKIGKLAEGQGVQEGTKPAQAKPAQAATIVTQSQQQQQVVTPTVSQTVVPPVQAATVTAQDVVTEAAQEVTAEPTESLDTLVTDPVASEDKVAATPAVSDKVGHLLSAGPINQEEEQLVADIRNATDPEEKSKLQAAFADATHFLSRTLDLIASNMTKPLRGALPGTVLSNAKNFALRKFESRSVLGRNAAMAELLKTRPAEAIKAWLSTDETVVNKMLEANKAFQAFHAKASAAIQRSLVTHTADGTHRRDSQYAMQDWMAEFIEQDANGKPTISPQLMTALTAGMYAAMQRNADKAVYTNNKDTALKLRLEELDSDGNFNPILKSADESDVALPYEASKVLNRAGIPLGSFAEAAAKAAYQSLGLKIADNGMVNADEKLQLAFKHMIENAIMDGAIEGATVVDITSSTNAEGKPSTKVRTISDNQLVDVTENMQPVFNALYEAGYNMSVPHVSLINFNDFTTDDEGKQVVQLHGAVHQARNADDEAGGFIDQLITTPFERASIHSDPSTIVYGPNERIGDTGQTVPPAYIERFQKISNSGFTPSVTGLLLELADEETRALLGGAPTQQEIDDAIKGNRDSREGLRKTVQNDVKVLSATYNKLKLAASQAGKVMNHAYLKVAMWGNGRFGYDSDFNPVATKLHRNMWHKDEWKRIFTIGDESATRKMMLAIAEGFDITSDKKFTAQRLKALRELMAKPEMVAGVVALQAIHAAMSNAGLTYDVNTHQAQDWIESARSNATVMAEIQAQMPTVLKAVKTGGMKSHSFLALDTLARYKTAKANGDTEFTHHLYEEVDGVTNGMSFILTHYSNLDASKYRLLSRTLDTPATLTAYAQRNEITEEAARGELTKQREQMEEELYNQLARVGVFRSDISYADWKNSPAAKTGDTYEGFAAAINKQFEVSRNIISTSLNAITRGKDNVSKWNVLLNHMDSLPSVEREVLLRVLNEVAGQTVDALQHGKTPKFYPAIQNILQDQLDVANAVDHFISTDMKDPEGGTYRSIARNSVKPLVLISGYGAGQASLYRTLITQSLAPVYHQKMQNLLDLHLKMKRGEALGKNDIPAKVIADAHDALRNMATLVSGRGNRFSVLAVDPTNKSRHDVGYQYLWTVGSNGSMSPLTEQNISTASEIRYIELILKNSKGLIPKNVDEMQRIKPILANVKELHDAEVSGAMSAAILENAKPVHNSGIKAALSNSFGNAFDNRDRIVSFVNGATNAASIVIAGRFRRARTQLAEKLVDKYLSTQSSNNEELLKSINHALGSQVFNDNQELNSFMQEFTKNKPSVVDGDMSVLGSIISSNAQLSHILPSNLHNKFINFYEELLSNKLRTTELSKKQERKVLSDCMDLLPILHNQLTKSNKNALLNKWHGLLLAQKMEVNADGTEIADPANKVTTPVRTRTGRGAAKSNYVNPRGIYSDNGAATNVLPVHHTDALIQLLTSDDVSGMLNFHDAVGAGTKGSTSSENGMADNSANRNFTKAFDEENVPTRLMELARGIAAKFFEGAGDINEASGIISNPSTVAGELFNAIYGSTLEGKFNTSRYMNPALDTAITQLGKSASALGITLERETPFKDYQGILTVLQELSDSAHVAHSDVVTGHKVIHDNTVAIGQYARADKDIGVDLTHRPDPKRQNRVVQLDRKYASIPSEWTQSTDNILGSHANADTTSGSTDQTIKVETADDVVNTFNALANVGIVQVSEDHQAHLADVASLLIGKAIKPLTVIFKSVTEGNTSFGSVAGNVVTIVNATKPSKLKPWVRGALRMSSQEVYVHEMLHAISQHGIENIPGADRVIDIIRRHAKQELEANPKWEDFRKDNAEMLKRVFYPVARKGGFTDHNHEFVAYGLSNEAMVNFLKEVSAPKLDMAKMFAGDTVFAKLTSFIAKSLEFITNKFRGLSNESAYHQLYDLTARIAGIQDNHDSMVTRVGNMVDKLAPMETANKLFRDGLEKLATIPENAQYNRVQRVAKGSAIAAQMFFTPGKTMAKNVIAKHITSQFTRMMHAMETSDSAVLKDLAQNTYSMRGNTDENTKLLAKQRKVTSQLDTKRQALVDAAVDSIRNSFAADTDLNSTVAEHMHKVLHRADLGSLTYQGKSLEDMSHLLTDSSALDNYATQLTNELLTEKDGKYYVVQAENLGHYQIHEESFLELPRMNAYAISRGVMNATNASEAVIAKIDALATVHALKSLDPRVRASVAQVIDTEVQRGDLNGVGTTLGIIQDIKERQAVTRGINRYAMPKVLVSEKYDERVGMRSSTSDNDQTLLDMSYTLSHSLPAIPEFGIPATYIYVSNYAGFSQSQESAMKFFRMGNGKAIPVDVNAEVANRDDIMMAKTGKDSKHYSSGSLIRSKPVNMIPQYSHTGIVTGYVRNLPASFKDNNLMRTVDFAQNIANTQGIMHVLETQHTANEEVIAVLKDMFDKQYKQDPKAFVEVSKNSSDPVIRGYAQKMTPETWDQVRRVFGEGKPFMVRRDSLGNVFGINKYSFNELWEKDAASRNVVERGVHDLMIRLFGRQALAKMNAADDKWKAFVSLAKDRVIIAGVSNAIDNMKSNLTTLKLHGIPTHKVASDTLEGMNEVMLYAKKQRQLNKLENSLKAIGLNISTRNKLLTQRAELLNQLRTSPVRFMVDEGFMESIEELTGDEVSSAVEKIGFLSKLNEKYKAMPNATQTVLDNLLVTKNTQLYSFLKDFAQLGDFAARYTLIKHLTANKGMTLEEASNYASDYFIYYASPNGRYTQMLDDYGVLPFFKYALRVQKHIIGTVRRYPVQSAAALGLSMAAGFGAPAIFGSVLTLPRLMSKLKTPFNTVGMLMSGVGTNMVL